MESSKGKMKTRTIGWLVSAAGASAVGALSWFLYDRYECQSYNFNTAYCNVRDVISGFDRDEIEDIDVGIYFDSRLSPGERRKAMEAFGRARQSYYTEFGINLVPSIEGRITAPENIDDIDSVIDNDVDFSIVYMDRIRSNVRNRLGIAYREDNIVIVNAAQDTGCIESTTAHEIGHLFYAEHCGDVLCTMFKIGFCFSPENWCERDRAVIELYKHRWW